MGSDTDLKTINTQLTEGQIKWLDENKPPEFSRAGFIRSIIRRHIKMYDSICNEPIEEMAEAFVEGDSGKAEELGSILGAVLQDEIVNQQRPGGLLA